MRIHVLCGNLASLLLGASASGQVVNPETHARYDLQITLRPAASRFEVKGSLRLPAVERGPERDSVTLFLSSWIPTLEISAVEPRGMRIRSVTTDSAEGDRRWTAVFDHSVPASTPIMLRFAYTSDSVRSAQLRITAEGSLAGGGGEIWYPRLAYDSLGVGVLRFRVPQGETVVATGTLDSTESDRENGIFTYRVDRGSKFGFASGKYKRLALGSTPAVSLYLLKDRANADSMLRRVQGLRRVLETEFGRMGTREYSVVEVEFGGSVGGTSEFGFFLADRSYVDRGLPIPFIGHEAAHAWWGNLVSTKPGPGRTLLTEGLASYAMIRALETVEGAGSAERFRQSKYPGYEASNSPAEYFALSAAGIEHPIASFIPKSQYEILTMHRMANTRGWMLLDMLSREIGEGDGRFASILRSIVAKHSESAISFAEFREEVEARSGRPIRWFFDDWFSRTGAPEYTMHWRHTPSGVSGEIRQPAPVYRATLPVEIRGVDGQRLTKLVWVGDTATSFEARVGFRVREVVLDPSYRVLRWTPELRARSVARVALTAADFERRFGSARRAVELYRRGLDSGVVEPDTAGIRFALGYGLALSALAMRDSTTALESLRHAVRAAVRDSLTLPRAYLLLARLAHASGMEDEGQRAARDAAISDAMVGNRTGVGESVKALPWVRQ